VVIVILIFEQFFSLSLLPVRNPYFAGEMTRRQPKIGLEPVHSGAENGQPDFISKKVVEKFALPQTLRFDSYFKHTVLIHYLDLLSTSPIME
jgi:hypothetical protein